MDPVTLVVAVAGVILGGFSLRQMGLYVLSSFSTSGPEAIPARPWIETGYPVEHRDRLWRVRVCNIHHRLYLLSPNSPPEPLHHFLNLDATAHPFKEVSLSLHPGQLYYDPVHRELTNAFQAQMQPLALRMNQGEEVSMADAQMFEMLVTVYGILSNDRVRREYMEVFVPVLTKWDALYLFKEKGVRAKERLKKLEALCA